MRRSHVLNLLLLAVLLGGAIWSHSSPFWMHRVWGEVVLTPTGDTSDQGPAITQAMKDCQSQDPKCTVYLAPGTFYASQIVMEQWGGSLVGSGVNRTIIVQYLNGVNTDLIRHKKVGGLTGDSTQHWFEIRNLRLRKGVFGDPRTSDTVGSGINFCTGSQGEASRIQDVLISGFPDAGIRYGCPEGYYGEGDPVSGVGTSNGGYVPGYITNVAFFGNGRTGLFFDRKRLIISRFTGVAISGDGNGWRTGEGSLVEVDGGCGGGNVCGNQITLIGLKSEAGGAQNYALKLTQGIGEMVVVQNVSHKVTGGGRPPGDVYAIYVTDDTPGASPDSGHKVQAIGVGGLFIDGYLKDDSRAETIIYPAHHTRQTFIHDPWTSAGNWDYCGGTWPAGYMHVAGPNTSDPGHPCVCYQGDSRRIDDLNVGCINIP